MHNQTDHHAAPICDVCKQHKPDARQLGSPLIPHGLVCEDCSEPLAQYEQQMIDHARAHVFTWMQRALTAERAVESLSRDLATLRAQR